jgi:hypothetical protein
LRDRRPAHGRNNEGSRGHDPSIERAAALIRRGRVANTIRGSNTIRVSRHHGSAPSGAETQERQAEQLNYSDRTAAAALGAIGPDFVSVR